MFDFSTMYLLISGFIFFPLGMYFIFKPKPEKSAFEKANPHLKPAEETEDAITFFDNKKMPCCGSSQYYDGPSGGMTTNIECCKCGRKYNANIMGFGPRYIEEI